MIRNFFLFCGLFLLTSNLAIGEVYKYVDKNNKVHYSTTPPFKGATRAELPTIIKKDFSISKNTLLSCHQHGGIDCTAGPDIDGSVICTDGFKNATARFNFHCLSAQLEIIAISNKQQDGSFIITVRNKNSVTARDVTVLLRQSNKQNIPLEGRGTIDPFGIEEYTLVQSKENPAKILKRNFFVNCLNCQ